MPKNGNRGANVKRPNAPSASNNEEIESNVIFRDEKSRRKAKQGSTADDSVKKGGDIVPASGDGQPKKPDTRKLVSNSQKALNCRRDTLKMQFGNLSSS